MIGCRILNAWIQCLEEARGCEEKLERGSNQVDKAEKTLYLMLWDNKVFKENKRKVRSAMDVDQKHRNGYLEKMLLVKRSEWIK